MSDKVQKALSECRDMLAFIVNHADIHSHYENAITVIANADEALAPEPRFYKGQSVLARDPKDRRVERHVYHILYTEKAEKRWEIIGADLDAESIINWVEHDGKGTPVLSMGSTVAVQTRCGDPDCTSDDIRDLQWKHNDSSNDVMRYAIIPLPEWLDQ